MTSSSNYFHGYRETVGNPAWCGVHFLWAEYQPEGHYQCPEGHPVEVFDPGDRVTVRPDFPANSLVRLGLAGQGPFEVENVERVPDGEEPTWGHNQFLIIFPEGRRRRLSAYYFTHA